MKKIEMTHGPIGRKTIRFALLLALTGMLQQVFNTIDTIIRQSKLGMAGNTAHTYRMRKPQIPTIVMSAGDSELPKPRR